MLDNLESFGIGAVASAQDPCIVIDSFIESRRREHNNKTLIDEHLSDLWIWHEGVFCY